jgi:hypothetical protein
MFIDVVSWKGPLSYSFDVWDQLSTRRVSTMEANYLWMFSDKYYRLRSDGGISL